MNAKLFLAQLLAQGCEIPTKAHRIFVERTSVEFYAEHPFTQKTGWGVEKLSDYIYNSNIEFENEQIAYDTYTLNFEDEEFTVEEFNVWLKENPNIIEETRKLQESAVKRLAELGEVINTALKEGEDLAAKAGLPFVVKLGGSMQDVRKLAAVDWDSSSMYC